MARSLSANMYGSDDNDLAESIAGDALIPVPGAAGTDLSDYWGKTKDDDAVAKGNNPPTEKDVEVKILRKEAAGGGDNEGLNDSTKGGQRHRKGPMGNA